MAANHDSNQGSDQSSRNALRDRILQHLEVIYPELGESYAEQLIDAMHYGDTLSSPDPHKNRWDESDVLLITYGNTITRPDEAPLQSLRAFLHNHLAGTLNNVHILPFFPYSSDDGFSVINYLQVNETLGEWADIEKLAEEFQLMSDVVINHCSSRSEWFEQFKRDEAPGNRYFVVEDPETDLSDVVRPRTNPLLREVETLSGTRHVWCTFSHDQVDLNFANPDVLLEFVNIFAFYLSRGVKIFRLDAIAFIWKQIGTTCLNLTETHEIVRLLRTLIEHRDPDAVIITETNIPNRHRTIMIGLKIQATTGQLIGTHGMQPNWNRCLPIPAQAMHGSWQH